MNVFYFSADWSKLLQHEEVRGRRGGCDSETAGEMSFQQRRKLLSDSDCGFSLFAITDKQTEAGESVVEGDTFLRGSERRSRVASR